MKIPTRGTQTALAGIILVVVAAVVVSVYLASAGAPGGEGGSSTHPPARDEGKGEGEEKIFSAYAGSRSCRECHQEAYDGWKISHHAEAERPVDPARDRRAFDPPRTFSHGTQTSEARVEGDRLELVTLGFQNRKEAYPVERVFGVYPLRQFLIPAPGGRYQVTELAWDPANEEWFDVYGDEDRQPGEWGHWTGRGMTWNSMCAACHNTRVLKNYDYRSDTYRTRIAEMGVGCEACHGPLADHVAWQREHRESPADEPDPPFLAKDRLLPLCGSCHSRRMELTGDYRMGELYLDHYTPVIPDDSDIYYPDGQVRDEDFEYVSFLSSRMHDEGVRCIDCHEPHSVKLRRTGNALCLKCHEGKVDPGPHSHHEPDTPGGRCYDCHMPLTTYMQRHPRRDHGFTIPDPLLTKKYGVPNACNRCHADRSVDWALETVQEWYGERMDRHTRTRAVWIAEARAGNDAARARLMELARSEKHSFWRAILTGLLKLWPYDETVRASLVERTGDYAPLVRTMAARALEPSVAVLPNPAVNRALARLLKDEFRSVRVEAAWALRRTVDPGSRAGKDLWNQLEHNLDQPTGLLQMGLYNFDRGYAGAALPYFRRAVEWDGRSPELRRAYAVGLSSVGETRAAVRELRVACRLDPDEPRYFYDLALGLAEAGKLGEAVEAFEKTTGLDPGFVRAWYNLGLAHSRRGEPERAIRAIEKAESLDPQSAEFPYARATILHRIGRFDEARRAAETALQNAPEFTPARQLLDLLDTDH